MAIFRFPSKFRFWWCYLVHVCEHVGRKNMGFPYLVRFRSQDNHICIPIEISLLMVLLSTCFWACLQKKTWDFLIGLDSGHRMTIFGFPSKFRFWWCYLVHISEHVCKKRLVIFWKKHEYLLIGLDSGHRMTIFGFTLKFRFQQYIYVHIW